MNEMGWEVKLEAPYGPVLERVIAALKAEGFGVLTRIDVHDAFKEKLGVEFRHYTILGACNPALAYKALSSRPDVGLMLPCNVVVEEAGSGALVRIADPVAMMQAGNLAGAPELQEVSGEAEARLKRVVQVLRAK